MANPNPKSQIKKWMEMRRKGKKERKREGKGKARNKNENKSSPILTYLLSPTRCVY